MSRELNGREPAQDGLRDHLADRHPGTARRPCPLRPRPLGNRGPAALGPRRHLRRRPLPGPHRQRPPRHGQPAQPGNHHPAPDRANQRRRRPALPRPPARQAPAGESRNARLNRRSRFSLISSQRIAFLQSVRSVLSSTWASFGRSGCGTTSLQHRARPGEVGSPSVSLGKIRLAD